MAKKITVADLKIEDGHTVALRSQETLEMYELLDRMGVNQSIKMPKELASTFHNAKNGHKRNGTKVFVYRNIDKYNIRIWRVEDGKVLRTLRNKRKK